jgi:mono/diheme cytochrome c family protein
VYCSRCHGGETHSLNIIPDLRRSAALSSAVLWKSIVIDGALEPNGMIGWSQFMTPEEAELIRAYVAAQARMLQQTEARAPLPSQLEPPVIEPPVIDPVAIDPTAL